MVKKKKRIVLAISIVVIFIILITAILVTLYITTDAFKSSKTLFEKYLGQNIEDVINIASFFEKDDYDKLLEQNKYTNNTEITMNYTEGVGTASEKTDSSINNLKLNISGQVDKTANYNYQKMDLYNSDTKTLSLEYMQNNNDYGIRFSDLFRQFTTVENSNLSELVAKLPENTTIPNIPDTIDIENDFGNILEFSQEEIENIKNRYVEIISQNTSEENFSRQKNGTVTINEQNIGANAYILTLTKEQLNDIYIKLLEELKQDDIILSKIDKLQQSLEKYNIIDSDEKILDKYNDYIDETITKINEINIGNEEAKMLVCENNGQTIKTIIETPDYTNNIEYIDNQFIQLSNSNTENSNSLIISKNNNEINIEFDNQKSNNETSKYNINITKQVEDKRCNKIIKLSYEDETNILEANINDNIEIVDNFEEQLTLDNENSIKLNDLEAEQLQNLITTINERTNDAISTVLIPIRDELLRIAKNVGWVSKDVNFENVGLTQTEIDRFNVKFEFLGAEKVKAEEVVNIINSIKGNIIDVETSSEQQFKLKLDINNSDEEKANIISNYIAQSKNDEYNISIEYNQENGLAQYVVINRVED